LNPIKLKFKFVLHILSYVNHHVPVKFWYNFSTQCTILRIVIQKCIHSTYNKQDSPQ